MSDERLYRYISPIEALEMDARTGNAIVVAYWLKAEARWFDQNADIDDLARRDRVRNMLTIFENINAEFGEGASWNLLHPNLDLFTKILPPDRRARQLSNAIRFRDVTGPKWFWLGENVPTSQPNSR